MGEKMTLEQVRDWHRKTAREKDVCGELMFPGPNESPFYRYPSEESKTHDAMADAIDAHLTQPAQAVDVGAIERSDVWVVQDEAGHPIHCAGWPQACREHIREAINEHGIEEARAWKVLHYTNGATA